MNVPESLLEVREYNNEGYRPVVDYGAWRVALLNYSGDLLPENLASMQRHNETDEVFVLLAGRCILFIGEGEDTVLFKPNLLMRIRNACTEADFLSAVARFIRPLNANLKAGDSPGQFRHRAAGVMRGVGMDAVLEAEKITYAEFESGGVLLENPKARHMKRFHIAKPVVEADCIVNLCRPKSHIEARAARPTGLCGPWAWCWPGMTKRPWTW